MTSEAGFQRYKGKQRAPQVSPSGGTLTSRFKTHRKSRPVHICGSLTSHCTQDHPEFLRRSTKDLLCIYSRIQVLIKSLKQAIIEILRNEANVSFRNSSYLKHPACTAFHSLLKGYKIQSAMFASLPSVTFTKTESSRGYLNVSGSCSHVGDWEESPGFSSSRCCHLGSESVMDDLTQSPLSFSVTSAFQIHIFKKSKAQNLKSYPGKQMLFHSNPSNCGYNMSSVDTAPPQGTHARTM